MSCSDPKASRWFAFAGISAIGVVCAVSGCLVALPATAGEPTATSPSATTLVAMPSRVELFGREARHRIVLQRTRNGAPAEQLDPGNARWTSRDASIAVVDGGSVVPRGNGRTVLTATIGAASVDIPVSVSGWSRDRHWSFRNDVQPVLTKAGCNSGACHGALAGKGGFKLSLRGYDTPRDYHTITRQAKGRRVELADPARSLILLKATAKIPHKGGLRFDESSAEYRILAGWLVDGAPPPRGDDPTIERIDIAPGRSIQKLGAQFQVVVVAHFSDGRSVDVTPWCKFSSTNETVGTVDASGRVTIVGQGEGAVMAWYQSKIAVAGVTVPFARTMPDSDFSRPNA